MKQARGYCRCRKYSIALVVVLIAIAINPLTNATAGGNFIVPQGTHFVDGTGRAVFIWGVNYVGHPDRSWTMWEDGHFNGDVIASDFALARAAAANVVRVFIRNPLPAEIAAGKWDKLDTAINLAKQQGLRLLVTLHDYSETDLRKVSATAAAIAARYANESAVFGYDLMNEPHLSDLIAAQYPSSPPLITNTLIDAFGVRMSQDQVNAWRVTDQGRPIIPSRFSDREAYYAANGYRIFQEFVAATGAWVQAHEYNGGALDYLASPDSARWRPLLAVLDGTVAAWLQPQLAALRAVDRNHPVTVGYNDPVFAQLPANGQLSFASLHRYPNPGQKPLRVAIAAGQSLQQVFPSKPVLMEEFGYSNAGRSTAATAADEAAFLLSVSAANLAGAVKWSLNDVVGSSNERERRFGLYDVNGAAKPAVARLRSIAEYLLASDAAGGRGFVGEDGDILGYTYRAPDALILSRQQYQDDRMSFAASDIIQVAVSWTGRTLLQVTTSGPVVLTLNPRTIVGRSSAVGHFALTKDDGRAVPFELRGETVSFSATPNVRYWLRVPMNAVAAKVEIVWPHDGKAVQDADQANIGAYLLHAQSLEALCGAGSTTVRLWQAQNNGVEQAIGIATARTVNVGGRAFVGYNFDNVDVSATRDPSNKLYFRLAADGWDSHTNIWSHAADARTYFPQPDLVTGVAKSRPGAVDAKIEIVWPHDNLPVDRAGQVNVLAYVFQQGTTISVPADWQGTVRLWRALNNGVAEQISVGQKVLKSSGSMTIPAWEFNDIDVSKARETTNKYFFRLTVDNMPSYSNIWGHGKDARTYFPQVDTPLVSANCP